MLQFYISSQRQHTLPTSVGNGFTILDARSGLYEDITNYFTLRFLAVAFGSLIGSTIISGLLVTPALLVHFFWYKPNPTEHRRYVKDNVEAWLFWAGVNTSISWYLALMVDLLPTVVRFIVSGAWGHVSEGFKSKIEMYNSVKNTIKPLLYAGSGWASWVIIFAHIYQLHDLDDETNSRANYTNVVSLSLSARCPIADHFTDLPN